MNEKHPERAAAGNAEKEPRGHSRTAPATWARAFWRAMRGTRGVKKQVGQYRILRHLAQGGMTDVFLGETVDQGRSIVVKFLQEGAHEVVSERMRFQRATRIGAVMNHVHIASILYGGDWDGQLCIVEEYVNGVDLAAWLKQHQGVPLEVALLILRDLCSAVIHVHERGVVHRDLKPANVMFSVEGEVKLMDFGIARRLDESLDATEMGMAPATISYAAPEQLEPNRARDIGRHTDVWALGVICYELFAGVRPFTGDRVEVERAILSRDPQPLTVLKPELPMDLARQVIRMLSRDIGGRCRSAEEVLDALEHGIDELGVRNQGKLLRAYAREPERVKRELDNTRRERVEEVARSTTRGGAPKDIPLNLPEVENGTLPLRPQTGTVVLTDPLAPVPARTQPTRGATPGEIAEVGDVPVVERPSIPSGGANDESDEIEIPGSRRWPWLLAAAMLVAVVGLAVPQVREMILGGRQYIPVDSTRSAFTTPDSVFTGAGGNLSQAESTSTPSIASALADSPKTARPRVQPGQIASGTAAPRPAAAQPLVKRPAEHPASASGGPAAATRSAPASASDVGQLELALQPRATVYANDVLVVSEREQATVRLPAGTYRIRAEAKDFPAKVWEDVRIEGGATLPLRWNFTQTVGYLRIRSANDYWGTISVAGVEGTHRSAWTYRLPPGVYQPQVQQEGFSLERKLDMVRLSAGDTILVEYSLQRDSRR